MTTSWTLAALVAVPLLLASCAPPQLTAVDDTVPPTVRIVQPRQGERFDTATPEIQLDYRDDDSGVAAVTFSARINGLDYSTAFDHYANRALGRVPSSRPLPLGENRMVVEVADRAGNVGRDEVIFINASGGWLETMVPAGAEPKRAIELIVDASGSMRDPLGTSTRMDVAKGAINGLVEELPDDQVIGLRVFYDCRDIVQHIPIEPLDKGRYQAEVGHVEPSRFTPIVGSLLRSLDALAEIDEGERVAVLLTDGAETCGGDLDEARSKAEAVGARIVVIAFDIGQKGLLPPLRDLAERTGGSFFEAYDAVQLSAALEQALRQQRYEVFDLDGNLVAHGVFGDSPLELPVGRYRLLSGTNRSMVTSNFGVEPLQLTTISLRRTELGLAVEVHGPTAPD